MSKFSKGKKIEVFIRNSTCYTLNATAAVVRNAVLSSSRY